MRNRPYVALIYVDVVELDGRHIRKFYAGMADRFQQFIEQNKDRLNLDRLRPEVSPLAAVMLVSRLLLNYFAVEIVSGVRDHFGADTDTTLEEELGREFGARINVEPKGFGKNGLGRVAHGSDLTPIVATQQALAARGREEHDRPRLKRER